MDGDFFAVFDIMLGFVNIVFYIIDGNIGHIIAALICFVAGFLLSLGNRFK